MNSDELEKVKAVCDKARGQGKENLRLTRKERKILNWLVQEMENRTRNLLVIQDSRDIGDPGFYFDPYLKVVYMMSSHMKTGPLPQALGHNVLELMKTVHANNPGRLQRQEMLRNKKFLALDVVEMKKKFKPGDEGFKKAILLLKNIYKTIRTEKPDNPPKLWKTRAFQAQYGDNAKGLESLAYKIGCCVLAMKFSVQEDEEAPRRPAIVGPESVGKSFFINHIGNPKLTQQFDSQGILPSTAGMGTQVICIVRDAKDHSGKTMCRIGESEVSVENDDAIYEAVNLESNRIKDLKAKCEKKKILYDPGCDVDPMIAQSHFWSPPDKKIKVEIMDVPGLKKETKFQTVLAFAISTCLVLCVGCTPEDLRWELSEEGQLRDMPETLEMAGAIRGFQETLPVVVMATRDVTEEQFELFKGEYEVIAREAFTQSRKFKILYGNCAMLKEKQIETLASEFYKELKSHKVVSSTARTSFNNIVPELQTYLTVFQEGLEEMMLKEEEEKHETGEKKAMSYTAFRGQAYRSVTEMQGVSTKKSWKRFFEERQQAFAERSQHWNNYLEGQIQKGKVMGHTQESWVAEEASKTELFYQCLFAMLSASADFGEDQVFHDTWRPFTRFSRYLIPSPHDELCGGNHRTLDRLLAGLYATSIELSAMGFDGTEDLCQTWRDLQDPGHQSADDSLGELKQKWRAKSLTEIYSLQQPSFLGSAWAAYHALMRNYDMHQAFRPDKLPSLGSLGRPICLINLPSGRLESQWTYISQQLPDLEASSCENIKKARFVSRLADETCKILFQECNIFKCREDHNLMLRWLNKLHFKLAQRLLAKRNMKVQNCAPTFTPFAEHMMRVIGSSWEEKVEKTLAHPTVSTANKAKEMVKAIKKLPSSQQERLKVHFDVIQLMVSMLSMQQKSSLAFNKVMLAPSTEHFNCEELASAMHTEDVHFEYVRPPPKKILLACGEHLENVAPSVVLLFRAPGVKTCDPTDTEKAFLSSVKDCPSVTHVIVVVCLEKQSPEKSDDFETRWEEPLPNIQLTCTTLELEKDVSGRFVASRDQCQLLLENISKKLSEAPKMFQKKVDLLRQSFDAACDDVIQRVRESKERRQMAYMRKDVDSFYEHVKSMEMRSMEVSPEEASEYQQFDLPDETFLCSAFGQKNDFGEQPCRTFMLDIIVGQLVKRTKTFAAQVYRELVEESIAMMLEFFTESGQQVSLTEFMATYEKECGEKFDEMLALGQDKKKKKEAAEAREQFEVVMDSSPEEFQDFRTARRLLSQQSYVDMYVGIVMLEATPLLEAMMLPLIHKGASNYQEHLNTALNFYKCPSLGDSSDEEPLPWEDPRLGHSGIWEFSQNGEWIRYNVNDQMLIESAYTDKKKGVTLQISTQTYELNWAAQVPYQKNVRTKNTRRIRRVTLEGSPN